MAEERTTSAEMAETVNGWSEAADNFGSGTKDFYQNLNPTSKWAFGLLGIGIFAWLYKKFKGGFLWFLGITGITWLIFHSKKGNTPSNTSTPGTQSSSLQRTLPNAPKLLPHLTPTAVEVLEKDSTFVQLRDNVLNKQLLTEEALIQTAQMHFAAAKAETLLRNETWQQVFTRNYEPKLHRPIDQNERKKIIVQLLLNPADAKDNPQLPSALQQDVQEFAFQMACNTAGVVEYAHAQKLIGENNTPVFPVGLPKEQLGQQDFRFFYQLWDDHVAKKQQAHGQQSRPNQTTATPAVQKQQNQS